MKEQDLIRQLNNEIEQLEISPVVLDNLKIEMARMNLQKGKNVFQLRKKKFWWGERLRAAVALCSVVALTAIAIPFSLFGGGASLSEMKSLPMPMPSSMPVPQTSSNFSSEYEMKIDVDRTKIDSLAKRHVSVAEEKVGVKVLKSELVTNENNVAKRFSEEISLYNGGKILTTAYLLTEKSVEEVFMTNSKTLFGMTPACVFLSTSENSLQSGKIFMKLNTISYEIEVEKVDYFDLIEIVNNIK